MRMAFYKGTLFPHGFPSLLFQATHFNHRNVESSGRRSEHKWCCGRVRLFDTCLSTQLTRIYSVMGPTGCGKSSVRLNVWSSRRFLTFVQLQKFIEKATGTTGMAGHNLQSCTSEVSVIRLEYPGVNLCVVDTPDEQVWCRHPQVGWKMAKYDVCDNQ